MEVATKILVVAGILNLAFGFLVGFPFAMARMKAPYAPRYLVAAHIGSLMQGTMLLALVIAFRYSRLDLSLAIWSASLLAASSFFLALKDTLNWVLGINDEFEQKPAVPKVSGLIGVVSGTVGLAILVFGVLNGL